MKLLHEVHVGPEVLTEEALTLCGCRPTDTFEGDTLHIDTARDIAEVLSMPDERVVVCSFVDVLPRSYDALLQAVEETRSNLLFASNPPAPETFRSRFRTVSSRVPSLPIIYSEFAQLTQERTLDHVVAAFPEVPENRLRRLYDEYLQSVGPVAEFVAALHDGNHEAAIRVSLGFGDRELELLHTELELQLQDRSLTNTVLTRASKNKLLDAALFREAQFGLAPSAHAALVLYTVLD